MSKNIQTPAQPAAEEKQLRTEPTPGGFEGLQAFESVSILGNHDGTLDDDLLDLLAEEGLPAGR